MAGLRVLPAGRRGRSSVSPGRQRCCPVPYPPRRSAPRRDGAGLALPRPLAARPAAADLSERRCPRCRHRCRGAERNGAAAGCPARPPRRRCPGRAGPPRLSAPASRAGAAPDRRAAHGTGSPGSARRLRAVPRGPGSARSAGRSGGGSAGEARGRPALWACGAGPSGAPARSLGAQPCSRGVSECTRLEPIAGCGRAVPAAGGAVPSGGERSGRRSAVSAGVPGLRRSPPRPGAAPARRETDVLLLSESFEVFLILTRSEITFPFKWKVDAMCSAHMETFR